MDAGETSIYLGLHLSKAPLAADKQTMRRFIFGFLSGVVLLAAITAGATYFILNPPAGDQAERKIFAPVKRALPR